MPRAPPRATQGFTAEQHASAVIAGAPRRKASFEQKQKLKQRGRRGGGAGARPSVDETDALMGWSEYQDYWLSMFNERAELPPQGPDRRLAWKKHTRQYDQIAAAAARHAKRTVDLRPLRITAAAAAGERYLLRCALHVSERWVRDNLPELMDLRVGKLELSPCGQHATRRLNANVADADDVVTAEEIEARRVYTAHPPFTAPVLVVAYVPSALPYSDHAAKQVAYSLAPTEGTEHAGDWLRRQMRRASTRPTLAVTIYCHWI